MGEMLKEARRLHKMGFAVHWLRERSKVPVEGGWGSGPRREWDYLKDTFQRNYNLGVRLGTPSKIGENYLAVIDVDVKSLDERHKKEAIHAAKSLLNGKPCPVVISGRGNGSRHYYCVTKKPFKTFNAAESSETVKVFMPSKTKVSKREREQLTDAEIKKGIRLSRAWEVSLYSDGRQVVLPPSTHPDSGRLYHWRSFLEGPESLPCLDLATEAQADREESERGARRGQETIEDWATTSVQLEWLDVPQSTVHLITKGLWKGRQIENRSDYLLVATSALVAHGLKRNDILTILTERSYFLGECAYDHAQTDSRKRAAQWLWNYTVKKVIEEKNIKQMFLDAPSPDDEKKLTKKEAKEQAERIEEDTHWKQSLETTKDGLPKATLNNCKLILSQFAGRSGFVGRNEFAANDFYLCDVPWRSKKGDAVTDADIHRIRFYCAETVGIEFPDHMVNQTLMEIADTNRFHPVRSWLKSLVWDGKPRIDTWLKDHAGAEGPKEYLEAVSRKVLIAMVKRVFEPGCKFDYVVILEGLQGIGKSTLLRKLAGDDWFSDASLVIGDKDAVLTMQSKWLIELGELSSMRKAETDQLKAFITQTTDRIRAPYGKRVEEFPRQCIFVGSTNNEEYLPDLTGNRRFWPVKCHAIAFDGISAVREQLFAEAVQFYQWGEPLYLDDVGVETLARAEQAKREFTDEWLSTVADIVNGEMFPRGGFEIKDVAKRMDQMGAHRMEQQTIQRIARCLKQLGCVSGRQRRGSGVRLRLWQVPVMDEAGRVGQGTLVPPKDDESPENYDFF